MAGNTLFINRSNGYEMMKFYMSFFFYLRHLNSEIFMLARSFFKSFISNEKYQFFELYFQALQAVVSHLNKKTLKHGLKFDIDIKLNTGYGMKSTLKCSTYEAFTILLNLLQLFPSVEEMDGYKSETYVSIASFVENYIKEISKLFVNPSASSISVTCDMFEQPSTLQMNDLLFLTQEYVRLFMYKSEYKYCYLGLVLNILICSEDRFPLANHISNFIESVLSNKSLPDYDLECFGRFIGPYVQFVYECNGLINQDSILTVNNNYCIYLRRTKKAATELTYGYINLIKNNYVKNISKVTSLKPNN